MIEPLRPSLGRSHFLRFERGGFFPYHRDSFEYGDKYFRIFVPLYQGSARDFIFLLGKERIELERGRAYFINTRAEHATMSFVANCLSLVLNVELSAHSIAFMEKHIFSN